MNIYENIILQAIPRILTNLDRDPTSKTYGCFDRNYWHYKIRDFPSAILQQSSLALAILYKNDFIGSKYYKNEKIKKWAIAGAEYWEKIQLKDGSFNEYYPSEHGYPPTVFSLHAVSETYRVLGIEPNVQMKNAMFRSCKFILNKTEKEALNQEMAAVAALYSVYLLTKKRWILSGLKAKKNKLFSKLCKEGWFSEYGGADIGYLSVALNYLGEYYSMSKDKSAEAIAVKIIDFLKYFVHPDGTVGGDYGSRNTEYLLPYGLEIFSHQNSISSRIIDKHFGNTNFSVDDRYLCHYFSHSLVKAFLYHKKRKYSEKLPCEINTNKYFPKAGLLVFSNDIYYAVLGLSKGGVITVFTRNNNSFRDCGYRIKQGKTIAANNFIDKYNIRKDGTTFVISGHMNSMKPVVSTPLNHIVLRIISIFMKNRLIPYLKKNVIHSSRRNNISFSRQVEFEKEGITITDSINCKRKADIISECDRFSLRYVPSSKFFQLNELDGHFDTHVFRNINSLKIKKYFDVKNNKIKKEIISSF
ncbi:MAG: hypothetical protein J7M14_03810 [Planctomycetes bacterium]|nr:hypothetical protein [Planctomycetota bacterium]